MRRRLSETTKVVGGGDKPISEKVVPDSIHNNARGKGIVVPQKIVGKSEAARLGGGIGSFIDCFQKTAGYWFERLLVIASVIERLVDVGAVNQSGSVSGAGDVCFESFIFCQYPGAGLR
jgi:hypothetical protein